MKLLERLDPLHRRVMWRALGLLQIRADSLAFAGPEEENANWEAPRIKRKTKNEEC